MKNSLSVMTADQVISFAGLFCRAADSPSRSQATCYDLGLYFDVLMGLFFTSTAAAICGEVRLFEQLYAKFHS